MIPSSRSVEESPAPVRAGWAETYQTIGWTFNRESGSVREMNQNIVIIL
jgi:hypothetical protein